MAFNLIFHQAVLWRRHLAYQPPAYILWDNLNGHHFQGVWVDVACLFKILCHCVVRVFSSYGIFVFYHSITKSAFGPAHVQRPALTLQSVNNIVGKVITVEDLLAEQVHKRIFTSNIITMVTWATSLSSLRSWKPGVRFWVREIAPYKFVLNRGCPPKWEQRELWRYWR